MGDVGIPLRRNSHVCRMGGDYHRDNGGGGGDSGVGENYVDGSGNVDGGDDGNCKVTYIYVTLQLPHI